MPQGSGPNYANNIIGGGARVSVANTARDGSGTIQPIVSAAVGGSGVRVDRQSFVQVTTAVSEGVMRLYLSSALSNPIGWRLKLELITHAKTLSTTGVAQPQTSDTFAPYSYPIFLAPGEALGAAPNNTESWDWFNDIVGSF